MSKEIEWEFEGNRYRVGDSFDEPFHKDMVKGIAWYKKRLYNYYHKIDRICLVNLYYPSKKPYWTSVDKVYQIIKITK